MNNEFQNAHRSIAKALAENTAAQTDPANMTEAELEAMIEQLDDELGGDEEE
jgi:hypothetical protein